MSEFTDLKTRSDFFELLNIPKKSMTYLLYKKGTENSYNTFEVEKKSGGVRIINAPNDDLKSIQKRLASVLWKTQKENWKNKGIQPNVSHAFEKDKSIISNAQIHRNKRFVLNLDLLNFFDSFHFGRVKGFFEKDKAFKLPSEVALVIAQITCYNGCLPQGAPSSPIITNLICNILDLRILKLAKKFKLDYTRYADDLTFSTNNKNFLSHQLEFMSKLNKEIERAGFKVNEKKTRLQFSDSRQEVTGLIVNRKISVKREYYKKTRAMAYRLYKNGKFDINDETGTINQLEGRFSFINQLDKYNNGLEYRKSLSKNNIEYQKLLLSTKSRENDHHKILLNLNSREREYQKFLYFKYFHFNVKPTIVTEGKTDIRYLKAALKNLYKDFPNLVEKKDGKFFYKVSFLKKSKRLAYFFNLTLDGADSMKNLYNFFCDKDSKRYPNYLKYFKDLSSAEPTNPTFFIFDNELSNQKKPLKSFINYVYNGNNEARDKSEKELREGLAINIRDSLYLLTNPLLENSIENEIEDLFDKETLSHKIEGKSFSKNDKSNNQYHYGKEIFSKFILENFENIDFENFRPILNNLSEIVGKYNKKSE